MTSKLWIFSWIIAATLSASPLMADPPVAPPAVPEVAPVPLHPCKKLRKEAMNACAAATPPYVKGGHGKHLGLLEDCVNPIMEGKGSPSNVKVNQVLVVACIEKNESR